MEDDAHGIGVLNLLTKLQVLRGKLRIQPLKGFWIHADAGHGLIAGYISDVRAARPATGLSKTRGLLVDRHQKDRQEYASDHRDLSRDGFYVGSKGGQPRLTAAEFPSR